MAAGVPGVPARPPAQGRVPANRSCDSVALRPACVDSHLKRYHLSFVPLSVNETGQPGSTSLTQRQWGALGALTPDCCPGLVGLGGGSPG